MIDELLRYEEVHYSYSGGSPALSGVNLGITRGRRTAILGRNGCGKTTLMLMGNGLLRPQRGSVWFDGKPMDYSKDGLMQVRSRVGFIFQETESQLFSASVEQDVSFGPFNLGWDEHRVAEATELALSQTGCDAFRHKPTHHLSGGQKKRAAVAGVVAMHPTIILADEPTAHLDPQGVDDLIDLFTTLHAGGMTFAVATHNLVFARSWFDDAIVMSEGRPLASGPTSEILADTNLLKKAGLYSKYSGE